MAGVLSAEPPKSNYAWYSELDYLLWYATQDGLSYATVANTSYPVSNTTTLEERDHFLTPDWSSGARAVFGLQADHWDTNLTYTYYFTRTHERAGAEGESIPLSSSDSSAGSTLLNDPSYHIFQAFPGYTNGSVDAHWRLNFNRLDWEVGRKLFFEPKFSLRPFFGLQALFLSQKLDVNTDTVFQSLDNGLPITDTIQDKNKNRFFSIGGRAGFSGEFQLGYGWNFYGNLAGSILWGKFKINQAFHQSDLDPSTGDTTLLGEETINHAHFASIFAFDLGLGLSWKQELKKSGKTIGLKGGWEQHLYTNINRLQNYYFTEINSGNVVYAFDRNLQKGNLSLSGFTVALSLLY